MKEIDGQEGVAEYLGDLQPHTLEQWRWRKIGPPYIKAGGRVRYRKSDVDRWLESRTVATHDGPPAT
jgi:hypothetical protein